uniref:Uncharacterized protein n=1 Tax=Panagrolaimus superbus TaxID=310955 RepID=A0A914XXI2_9BILA
MVAGIDQHLHEQVYDRATTTAKNLMVELQLGAEELIQKFSLNECCFSEGFCPTIAKQLALYRNQLREAWCYGIKESTIVDSGYVFLDFLALQLATNTVDFDQFWKKFITREYLDKQIEHYQEFILTKKPRYLDLMLSTDNFEGGKRGLCSDKFDPQESYKLSVSALVDASIKLGVAGKFLGVYEKTKVGFKLLAMKLNTPLIKSLVATRISMKRDIWPLQPRDMLQYFLKCETTNRWDCQSFWSVY